MFVEVYARHGGPPVEVAALEQHLMVHMATMGVARVLAFPEVIALRCPELGKATGWLDPIIQTIDPARNSIHIYKMLLKAWNTREFGARIEQVLAGG
ncbi:MAG: hypothetical protein N2423_09175 [Novosphingobium sp.]|nr:hypothetical protein [Novosphingobium sp.]